MIYTFLRVKELIGRTSYKWLVLCLDKRLKHWNLQSVPKSHTSHLMSRWRTDRTGYVSGISILASFDIFLTMTTISPSCSDDTSNIRTWYIDMNKWFSLTINSRVLLISLLHYTISCVYANLQYHIPFLQYNENVFQPFLPCCPKNLPLYITSRRLCIQLTKKYLDT